MNRQKVNPDSRDRDSKLHKRSYLASGEPSLGFDASTFPLSARAVAGGGC